MSSEQTQTPPQDPQPAPQREITVSVPEDRVEQFEALYERFLSFARKGQGAGEARGPRGRGRRRGYRRHHIRRAMFHLAMAEHGPGSGPGSGHGRCGRRQTEDESPAPAPTATL